MSSPAPHQAFCGKSGSIVITYEFVCKLLSILDVEVGMGPDGFHPKLLSLYQAVTYNIFLIVVFCIKTQFLQCGQLPTQWKVT